MAQVSKKAEHKIRKVMREFKAGTLKSGGGPTVTDPKQAIAIAYSEGRKASKQPDSPMNTKMKGDSPKARMKRKKQLGDSMI